MPAHIVRPFEVSLSIPIVDGAFAMGTWQGIWLGSTVTTVDRDESLPPSSAARIDPLTKQVIRHTAPLTG